MPLASVVADWLSSTEIRQTNFDEAVFSEDPFLARQIDEFKIIHSMKNKHPLLAYFFFATSNYMRSFMRLIFVSFLCILVFSFIYSGPYFNDDLKRFTNPENKIACIDDPFYLSLEIFLSIPIYPLKAKDNTTKAWIIFERILGYGALASFMSILLAPLALAHYKKKKEDDAEAPPGRV